MQVVVVEPRYWLLLEQQPGQVVWVVVEQVA
jgi:hypothetical protein